MPDNVQYITVGIPESDIYDTPPPYSSSGSGDPSVTSSEKKGSWLKRHLSPSGSKEPEKTIGVRMTREEFLKFFAKDHRTATYRKDVVEPPGGRKQWLQQRLEDFASGQLDDGAYRSNLQQDYQGLRKESALGKAADFMGQPYTPEGMNAIPLNPKK